MCSDFGAQDNKSCHCFHCFPVYLPWSDGTDAMIFTFWMLSFKPPFSLSSFTFIKMAMMTLYARQQKRQMCIVDFWTQRERERVEWFGRMALKHVYYHVRNELPVYVQCRMLGAGAWGWPREMLWGGRWEGGSCLGTHVHPWWIHVNVWQNQYSIVK